MLRIHLKIWFWSVRRIRIIMQYDSIFKVYDLVSNRIESNWNDWIESKRDKKIETKIESNEGNHQVLSSDICTFSSSSCNVKSVIFLSVWCVRCVQMLIYMTNSLVYNCTSTARSSRFRRTRTHDWLFAFKGEFRVLSGEFPRRYALFCSTLYRKLKMLVEKDQRRGSPLTFYCNPAQEYKRTTLTYNMACSHKTKSAKRKKEINNSYRQNW